MQKIRDLDDRLVKTARSIRVLGTLGWDESTASIFLESWRAGQPRLPEIPSKVPDLSSPKEELAQIIAALDSDHPVGLFLKETAQSYLDASIMLENFGHPVFSELSRKIYGSPRDPIIRGLGSNREAAQYFLDVTHDYLETCQSESTDYCITPQYVASFMEEHIRKNFPDESISILIDPMLASKAAAGANRIRIRGSTCYSPLDLPQLLHHELLVHSLTAINGAHQTNLKSLALSAPRTTATQEGLAIFAEMITNSMDLPRLRRVAARVIAIDLALGGADFIEVFRYFLKTGQSDFEAFHSSMRVFRGGRVQGGVAFTKDVVYLEGFVRVHEFLRNSILDSNIENSHRLFAGRLWTHGVDKLAPFFESRFIQAPRYEPAWVSNRSTLAAFLLYSDFTRRLHLGRLERSTRSVRIPLSSLDI